MLNKLKARYFDEPYKNLFDLFFLTFFLIRFPNLIPNLLFGGSINFITRLAEFFIVVLIVKYCDPILGGKLKYFCQKRGLQLRYLYVTFIVVFILSLILL
jgi:ABC-type spermidine/putrescine transport system permease subunit II